MVPLFPGGSVCVWVCMYAAWVITAPHTRIHTRSLALMVGSLCLCFYASSSWRYHWFSGTLMLPWWAEIRNTKTPTKEKWELESIFPNDQIQKCNALPCERSNPTTPDSYHAGRNGCRYFIHYSKNLVQIAQLFAFTCRVNNIKTTLLININKSHTST